MILMWGILLRQTSPRSSLSIREMARDRAFLGGIPVADFMSEKDATMGPPSLVDLMAKKIISIRSWSVILEVMNWHSSQARYFDGTIFLKKTQPHTQKVRIQAAPTDRLCHL